MNSPLLNPQFLLCVQLKANELHPTLTISPEQVKAVMEAIIWAEETLRASTPLSNTKRS